MENCYGNCIARVRQLAEECAGYVRDGAFVQDKVAAIEAAILAAARELLGEEPSLAEIGIVCHRAGLTSNKASELIRALTAARLAQIGEE